jgi:hypothetical protein
MATKVCGSCKQTLPTDLFHIRKKSVDGLCSKCKSCQSSYFKKYRESNKEILAAKVKKYVIANREIVNKRWNDWRNRNKEKVNTYVAEWWKNHQQLKQHHVRKRAALKRGAYGSHTPEQIKEIFARQKGLCNYCYVPLSKYHIDHIIPLSREGTNCAANLQILCVSCNTSKGNKMPWEYFGWA